MVAISATERVHKKRGFVLKLATVTFTIYLLLVVSSYVANSATVNIPSKPANYLCVDVNDALYIGDEKKIAGMCREFANKHDTELVVFVDNSLNWKTIEDFTDRLALSWSLGMRNRGNWIVVAIFTEQRKLRIACSPSLDNKLTNYRCTYIIDRIIAPRFRQNDYATGIKECIDALGLQMDGKFKIPWRYRIKHALSGEDEQAQTIIYIVFFGLIMMISYIANQYRRMTMGEDYYKFDVISADGTIGTGDIRTSYDRPDSYYDDGYYGSHGDSGGGGSSGSSGGGGGASGGW